ncbi:unnamed protein product [Prorocentrum cordatum]|uniref:Uncharacterized protein n=1 Tax=Prorocentrum cordatum TaxID=2364126 RepID=A0ABN9XSP5_9DINO|nr:unnamed protein product [Polarella glacialis]
MILNRPKKKKGAGGKPSTLVTAGNPQGFLAIYMNGTWARQSRIPRARGRGSMEEDVEEKNERGGREGNEGDEEEEEKGEGGNSNTVSHIKNGSSGSRPISGV